MRAHLSYLGYVLRHKWFVFQECVRLGIPWRGLVHDMSKFRSSEWGPYAHHFYNRDGTKRDVHKGGYYKPTDTGDEDFDFAWLLHQKRNWHHWQWWVLPEDEGGVKILPMQDVFRREMLADWCGAARAQGLSRDTVPGWYEEHKDKMQLHQETREWIEVQLGN